MPADYINFDESLVESVVSESKTQTIRYNWKTVPEVGDIVNAVNSATREPFAKLEITSVERITIKECANRDFDGHKNYESITDVISELTQYYNETFTAETKLLLLEYTVVSLNL